MCSLKYALNLASIVEFSDVPEQYSAAVDASVFTFNDVVKDSKWMYIGILAGIFCGFRLLAAAILYLVIRRFLVKRGMRASADSAAASKQRSIARGVALRKDAQRRAHAVASSFSNVAPHSSAATLARSMTLVADASLLGLENG